MWNRRVELDGFMPLLHTVRNSVPMFEGRVVPGTRTDLAQLPAMVSRGKEMANIFLGRLEPHMAENEFIAGEEFSVADITAWFVVRMAKTLQMDIEGKFSTSSAGTGKFPCGPAFRFRGG